MATLENKILKYLSDRGIANKSFTIRNDNDGKGVYIDAWNIEIPKPQLSDLPSDAETDIWVEAQFQLNKPLTLKLVENIYCNFLMNEWTNTLRTHGIIGPTDVITNDIEKQETTLPQLMQLRVMSFSDYSLMAGEFDRLRNQIMLIYKNLGWDELEAMSKLKFHSEIV